MSKANPHLPFLEILDPPLTRLSSKAKQLVNFEQFAPSFAKTTLSIFKLKRAVLAKGGNNVNGVYLLIFIALRDKTR